jgi:hypothetical protein
MLTIPGNEENTSQNHIKMLEWLSSRTPQTTNVGKEMRKKEPSYTVGGNAS